MEARLLLRHHLHYFVSGHRGLFWSLLWGHLHVPVLCLVTPPTLTLWLCRGALGVSSGLRPDQGNDVANRSSVPVS